MSICVVVRNVKYLSNDGETFFITINNTITTFAVHAANNSTQSIPCMAYTKCISRLMFTALMLTNNVSAPYIGLHRKMYIEKVERKKGNLISTIRNETTIPCGTHCTSIIQAHMVNISFYCQFHESSIFIRFNETYIKIQLFPTKKKKNKN